MSEGTEEGGATSAPQNREAFEESSADLDRQKRKIEAALDYLKSLPITYAGDWRREDLYD